MPLEIATYLSDLVASNPAGSDPLSGADDHMRLIKGTIKNTFPNFTGAPLNSTQAALDAAATAVSSGVSVLADGGARFKSNTKDGIENPAAGKVAIVAQDGGGTKQTVAEFTGADKKLKVLGPMQVVGAITGPGSVPIGGSIKWFSNTLPADGNWAWENGQWLTASAFPALAALWPERLVNGGASIALPDSREVVPVGNSTMGGTTARGIISNYASSILTTINGWFGAAAVALTPGQMPVHRHANTLTELPHKHDIKVNAVANGASGGNFQTIQNPVGNGQSVNVGSTELASTGITINNVDAGNNEAHSNVQPSQVVNWIVRIG